MNKNSKKAKTHLSKVDPVLAKIINKVKLTSWTPRTNYFESLVETIISQQLSDKAATTIIGRFEKLFPKLPYTPESILSLPDDKIRGSGISYAKVSYIKDLSQKIFDKKLKLETLSALPDKEIITYLISVKGIGNWSAEMFLMFSLGREDVFSHGDQGLKNAIRKLYKLKNPPTLKESEKISIVWKPYRTFACRYLWASLDLKD